MNKTYYQDVTGYIPQRLAIYSRQSKEIKIPYIEKDGEILFGENSVPVIPAYAVDDTNAKRKESAFEWAREYDRKNNKYIDPNIEFRDNTPIDRLRIVELECREEGGRAYKVVTPDGYYYDFREDILLDTIYEAGIARGGILLGQYVWAVVGTQMKLIRFGSKLYDRLLETSELRKITKKIRAKEWEVGGVYVGKNNSPRLFLGWVDRIDFHQDYRSFQATYEHLNNKPMWFSFGGYSKEIDPVQKLYSWIKEYNQTPYLDFDTPGNLIVKLDQLVVPDTFIKDCTDTALAEFTTEFNKTERSYHEWGRFRLLEYCSLRKTGDPIPDLPDFLIEFVRNKFNLNLGAI